MTPSARTIKNHRMDNNNNNNRRRRRGELLQIVSEGTGRFIVGGNWKCNGTRESVKALVEALNKNVPNIEKN